MSGAAIALVAVLGSIAVVSFGITVAVLWWAARLMAAVSSAVRP